MRSERKNEEESLVYDYLKLIWKKHPESSLDYG
jgi:hypothetical protein